MTNRRIPTHLATLKQEAKALLKSAKSDDHDALDRVGPYFRDTANPTLQQMQLVVAREYGFDSWSKLKTYVSLSENHHEADGNDSRSGENSTHQGPWQDLPVVHLTDMVVYPHTVERLFVGTLKSISALEYAQENDPEKRVLLVAKKDPARERPRERDLFRFGTVCTIMESIVLPAGTVKILVEGRYRARIEKIVDSPGFLVGEVLRIQEQEVTGSESESIARSVMKALNEYVQLSEKVPPDMTPVRELEKHLSASRINPEDKLKAIAAVTEQAKSRYGIREDQLASLSKIDEPNQLLDTISSLLVLELDEKQRILEMVKLDERTHHLVKLLELGPRPPRLSK